MTDTPILISCKPMSSEYKELYTIAITSDNFSIGRCINNSVVIPCLPISRYHCIIKKTKNNQWLIKDTSTFGITINNEELLAERKQILADGDVICLEPSREFIYKFVAFNEDFDGDIPKKRRKMEDGTLADIKNKFEQSQNNEMIHLEEKIFSIKHMHQTSIKLQEGLELDMNKKIEELNTNYAAQINNLKGGKKMVETKKTMLTKERDEQVAQVKIEMGRKMADLTEQITNQKHAETELLNENKLLKEKLTKEKEDFLSELSRGTSSKQDVLDKLVAKIRKQEEVRLKEKQELEEKLDKGKEQLLMAKKNELKALEEKRLREQELKQQVETLKALTEGMKQSELKRLEVEKQLNSQLQQQKKLSDEEKMKNEQLQKELIQAKQSSRKYKEETQQQVKQQEAELAALAADRISQQAVQSNETISTLQAKLESITTNLQLVEQEKNTMLQKICDNADEGHSKQSALTEVGELMESELQCSICSELFIKATTLNCSHTFCAYCIATWKKKKRDCPICRCSIKTTIRSLVLDTFIEKMVENLTEEMKTRREDVLKSRKEVESEAALATAIADGPSSGFYNEWEETSEDSFTSLHDSIETYCDWTRHFDYNTDSGSNDFSDSSDSN